jgi:hypothetical protein
MTAESKIAQGKMTLLQLAERLRNVSEACRRRGVSRSQFYEYKRAFQEQGLQGLVDRPPIPKSFPNETPSEGQGEGDRYVCFPSRMGAGEDIGPIEAGRYLGEPLDGAKHLA